MISAWVLYSIVVGGLFAASAWALEQVGWARRVQTRWLWAGALGGTMLLTVLGARASAVGTQPDGVGSLPAAVVTLPELIVGPGSPLRAWDAPLAWAWGILSALLLLGWAADALRTRMDARRWRSWTIDGAEVLRSGSVGPAVVGVWRPRIVLPDWFLALDASRQSLALLHEREHARARDPLLLACAHALKVALPWNPAVWWMVRRLRLAVEIDCDRRVVALRPGHERRYGQLLLDTAARTVYPLPLSVGLLWSRTMIERRVVALVAGAARLSPARVAALAGVAGLLVGAALLAPGPHLTTGVDVAADEGSAVRPEVGAAVAESPTFTPFSVAPDIRNRAEVVRALNAEYPPLLRDAGIGGTVQVWFLIGPDGRLLQTRINQSSDHAALDQAAIRVADVFEFTAAYNRDQPVPVWISLPITFMPPDDPEVRPRAAEVVP